MIADKGYPSKANRAWLREHDIAATIPECDDQISHRRKRPGRPIDFGPQQRHQYRARNVVERCFNTLKQWRGLAMRSDKTTRNYHTRLHLATPPLAQPTIEQHVLVSLDGGVLVYEDADLAGATPEDAVTMAVELIARLRACVPGAVLGVGVGPGIVSDGIVRHSTNRHWHMMSLRDYIAQASGLPVVVGSDNLLAALDEQAATGTQNLLVVTYAGGLAGMMIRNGEPIVGSASAGDNFGHVAVGPADGRLCRYVSCGKHGCFEAWLAPAPLAGVLAPIITAVDVTTVVVSGPLEIVPLVSSTRSNARSPTCCFPSLWRGSSSAARCTTSTACS